MDTLDMAMVDAIHIVRGNKTRAEKVDWKVVNKQMNG